jgi:hypothetical protein
MVALKADKVSTQNLDQLIAVPLIRLSAYSLPTWRCQTRVRTNSQSTRPVNHREMSATFVADLELPIQHTTQQVTGGEDVAIMEVQQATVEIQDSYEFKSRVEEFRARLVSPL